MGSGCTSGSMGSGVLRPTPDTSVIYTGPAIPSLGICTGDTLSEIEADILQQIINYSTGVGINLPDIDLTQCACFTQAVGCCGPTSCQSLTCIMQAYLDCLCTLYTDVQVLTTKVGAMYDGPYDLACLQNLTSTSKLPDIVQEVIYELCTAEAAIVNLQTQITNLTTGLPTTIGNFMSNAIRSCQTGSVTKTGSGATFQVTFGGFAPVGSVLPWVGNPAGVFTAGVGNSPGPMCGWNLANGANGTVDMRGYFPVGVNDGTMGGGSQNPEVDNAVNPGQTYGLGSHAGAIQVQLSSAQIPSVGVSGTVVGGTGSLPFYSVSRKHASTGDNTMSYQCDGGGTSTPCPSAPNMSVPFTIPNSTLSGTTGGGGGKHENRPPYMAMYFIQRMF